ncbi:hypothetical protein PHYPO_G00050550 [Pangasianodon hypophthalmus]|uniref:Uncharacterized protein n=1 Tax=Pangasianodon hypophthalmus TaxID=310915 RepID=A0A5N5M791_PANHP|nr:hypothetical protein PHYPO_G00050550 [Pangasianodon hypophthalmus]
MQWSTLWRQTLVPATLNGKNIGAVVLHAGTNDTRLRQTEILKKDFRSLIEKVRSTSPYGEDHRVRTASAFQRGIERFSSTTLTACTQAELEQRSSRTTSLGHYAPSDCYTPELPVIQTPLRSGPDEHHS